jgi:hypothetical protein
MAEYFTWSLLLFPFQNNREASMSMPKPEVVEKIDRDICMREIPRSEMGVSEADDYILYYCGTEYYEQQAKGGVESE